MKINQDYELLVQDLFLRITTAPGFRPDNGAIEKAFQRAARCAEVFFVRWAVEKDRLQTAAAAVDLAKDLQKSVDALPKKAPAKQLKRKAAK